MGFLGSKNTVETYSAIRDLGLKTVKWINFSLSSNSPKEIPLEKIKSFLLKNSPCLFIWEPKEKTRIDIRKGFILDVFSFDDIAKWMLMNESSLSLYNYLITTQISNSVQTNPQQGFVGVVFSDGRGKIYGETYHKPGVYNQRELTRPKKDFDTKYAVQFSTEDFSPLAIKSRIPNLLTNKILGRLILLYGNKRGYFEFVSGVQCKKRDIYTIGFIPSILANFPDSVYNLLCRDAEARLGSIDSRN